MASRCCRLRHLRWLIRLPPPAFQQESPVWTRCWEERDSTVEAAFWFPAQPEPGNPALRRDSPAPPVPVAKAACILLLKSLPARSCATCAPSALTSSSGLKRACCTFTPFGRLVPASKDI